MIKYDHHIKIYYKDVDQMGIVYYSRYYEYFEEARTELLASIGLDVMEVEKRGITLPVISSHCDYKRGAKFEQNILVEASITTKPKSKLHIDYFVFIENENSFSESEWNELYRLSKETFVDESEELKQTAAGAGLTDND